MNLEESREFITRLTAKLHEAGIAFMVTGSVASGYHGQMRMTNDVDVVIEASTANLHRFVDSLGDGYYVSHVAVREAIERRSMFNVIDLNTGWKADLILRKDRAFDIEAFGRRQIRDLAGVPLPVASAEDVILSKLDWRRESGSEVQWRDAVMVAALRWPELDQAYLQHWAGELGLALDLEDLLQEAGRLQRKP